MVIGKTSSLLRVEYNVRDINETKSNSIKIIIVNNYTDADVLQYRQSARRLTRAASTEQEAVVSRRVCTS